MLDRGYYLQHVHFVMVYFIYADKKEVFCQTIAYLFVTIK